MMLTIIIKKKKKCGVMLFIINIIAASQAGKLQCFVRPVSLFNSLYTAHSIMHYRPALHLSSFTSVSSVMLSR